MDRYVCLPKGVEVIISELIQEARSYADGGARTLLTPYARRFEALGLKPTEGDDNVREVA